MANQKLLGLVLATLAVILVPLTTACGGSIVSHVRTRTATYERNPVESSYDSDSPADDCEVRRRRQRAERRAEYCMAGIAEACISRPATTVDALASIEAVCLMDLLTEERCAELRASIPREATVEIPTPAVSAGTLTMLSPEGLQTYRYISDPIIWGDIEATCAARSTSGVAVAPVGTVVGTSGGSLPVSASLLGVPLVGAGTGGFPTGTTGFGGGSALVSYDVSSTLSYGVSAQVQITVTDLVMGTVETPAPVMVTGPMNVPVLIHGRRGDHNIRLDIRWTCSNGRSGSASGPIGIGFSIADSSC